LAGDAIPRRSSSQSARGATRRPALTFAQYPRGSFRIPYFLQRFSRALSETPKSAATCVVGISRTNFSSSSGSTSNRRLAWAAHDSDTGAAGSPSEWVRSSAAVTRCRFSGRMSLLSPFRNSTLVPERSFSYQRHGPEQSLVVGEVIAEIKR